jgi:hypothetical protein
LKQLQEQQEVSRLSQEERVMQENPLLRASNEYSLDKKYVEQISITNSIFKI